MMMDGGKEASVGCGALGVAQWKCPIESTRRIIPHISVIFQSVGTSNGRYKQRASHYRCVHSVFRFARASLSEWWESRDASVILIGLRPFEEVPMTEDGAEIDYYKVLGIDPDVGRGVA